MKKVIYIFLLTITACLFTELHAQGLYKNQEENKATSTTEYSPSILRAKPDLPPGPGIDESEQVPLGEGLLLLAVLAGLSAHRIHGKNRKTRNN